MNNNIKAEIVQDSLNSVGNRLTTFVLKFPRIVLAELNTHRALSKNSASSRAIPFEKMLEMVKSNPFIPIRFQKDHKGMQGSEHYEGQEHERCVGDWLNARDKAIEAATSFTYPITKQLRNRLLEPFMWHTVILSGTEFENFFALRAHADAEIHISDLAFKMLEEYNKSQPKQLTSGEWHIPFGDKMDLHRLIEIYAKKESASLLREEKVDSLEDLKIKIAIARCARISYFNYEGKDDYEADIKLFDKLVGGVPKHCFDSETEILTENGFINVKNISYLDKIAWIDKNSGKFLKFDFPKEIILNNKKNIIYHYKGKDIDLKVTDGHRLYVHKILSSKDRTSPLKMELVPANLPNSSRSKNKTIGESCLKMINKTFGSLTEGKLIDNINQYNFGQLCGFFIGDGFLTKDGTKSKIYFRLKKQRKISYLKNLINTLNGEINQSPNKIQFSVSLKEIPEIAIYFNKLFYLNDGNKTIHSSIFNCNQDFVNGLFDGLKNSDGSFKRKTWNYSTSSMVLKDKIIELGVLFGYNFSISNIIKAKNLNQQDNFTLNCATKNYILCNDSRKNKVSISEEFGNYYCVNIDNNILVTRRNGKIVLSGNCSPTEHVAQAMDESKFIGNFCGFKQYRYFFNDQNLIDSRVIKHNLHPTIKGEVAV